MKKVYLTLSLIQNTINYTILFMTKQKHLWAQYKGTVMLK